MSGVKLLDSKNNKANITKMLALKETSDKMANANRVRQYGHVVKRDDDNVLNRALMLEVNGH